MKNFLSGLLLIVLISSCASLQMPELKGEEHFNIEKIDGQNVDISAGGKIYNGNWFALKVKPSEFDLYVEGEYLGKLALNKKIKLKSKQETMIDSDLTVNLEKGAMFILMRNASKEQVQVRLSGKVRAGVWFFTKKVEINETRTFNGLKLNAG